MIIDASVAYKWLIAETGSTEAIAWIGRGALRAPALMIVEVGNAVSKRVRAGELAVEGAAEQLSRLVDLVSVIDESDYVSAALQMSVLLDHSIYDCVYLAMAEADDDRLLTADGKFAGKARQAGFGSRIVMLGDAG